MVTRIFAVTLFELRKKPDENRGNREGAATYSPMVVTPVKSTDVKLVQPLNALLGCIITGVQRR